MVEGRSRPESTLTTTRAIASDKNTIQVVAVHEWWFLVSLNRSGAMEAA